MVVVVVGATALGDTDVADLGDGAESVDADVETAAPFEVAGLAAAVDDDSADSARPIVNVTALAPATPTTPAVIRRIRRCHRGLAALSGPALRCDAIVCVLLRPGRRGHAVIQLRSWAAGVRAISESLWTPGRIASAFAGGDC